MRIERMILSAGLLVMIGLSNLAMAAPPTSGPADESNAEAIKLYARGQYADVIKLLDPAFAAGKAKIQERLLLARAFLHTGQQDAGLKVLESVLKTDSENPEACHLAGLVWFQRGKFKEAADLLGHAYRLKNSKDPAIASTLGQCYFNLGETAKAKELLQAALKEDIRNPTNSFLLAKISLANGSGAQAERFGLLALEAGMDTPELHHLLGQAYMLQRKYVGPILVKRIATSQKAGDIVDDNIVLGKVEGVEDQYKVCTKYCALYEGLTLLHCLAARFNVAVARQDSAMTEDGKLVGGRGPGDELEWQDGIRASVVLMIASGWFSAGEYQLAKDALRIWPGPEGRAGLDLQASVQIATKDFPGLEKTLATASEKKIFDAATVADFCYKAASVLRADGKRTEALAMLKKADAAVPTSAKVLRALASLSQVTGQLDDARQYYGRIVELFPDANDIDELRNTLKALAAQVEKTGGSHGTTLPEAPDDTSLPTRLPTSVPDVPLPR